MTEKERMISELPYRPWVDSLPQDRQRCRRLLFAFNHCDPDDQEARRGFLTQLLGKTGKHFEICAPFSCDYGYNIEIGEGFFASYNCAMVDCGRIIIGDHTMIAANTVISSAGHPVHPETRATGYEYGITTTIGSYVWIGAGVVVNPGVHIGDNVVIGSGSVVTKDIPDNVIAVGNPCRVLREITEEDRQYYFKKRRFDCRTGEVL